MCTHKMTVQLEYIDQTFVYYAGIMLVSYYAQNYAGIIGTSLVGTLLMYLSCKNSLSKEIHRSKKASRTVVVHSYIASLLALKI